MPFNPDLKKLAQKILFSRKNSNITHPTIHFNNVQVQRANQQRHLGIILDEMLIKRLRNPLPGKSLITIYKAIIRPHPDYGDILYDQPNNATFCQKNGVFSIQSSYCNYWCNSRYLTRKTFRRIGSGNT